MKGRTVIPDSDVVKFASSAGFDFTEAEISKARNDARKRQHESGELSDDALKKAAGGMSRPSGSIFQSGNFFNCG